MMRFNNPADSNAIWQPVAAEKTPEPAAQPSAVKTKEEAEPKIKSAAVFDQIQKRIETEGANLVKKMKGVLVFNINAKDKKTHTWTVDLKNGNGSVSVGPPSSGKPDCTFNTTDDNFFALATGKLDPTMAFMSGKLKIQGNMGLAMKLGPLLKSAPAKPTPAASKSAAAAAAAAAEPEMPQIKSTAVFEQMKKRVAAEGPELVKKMKGVLAFNINANGKTYTWTADLKNGSGSIRFGAPEGKPDCTFNISDDNFVALATGKMDPTMAFMGGKLKLQGNMSLAMKLGALLKPKSKL